MTSVKLEPRFAPELKGRFLAKDFMEVGPEGDSKARHAYSDVLPLLLIISFLASWLECPLIWRPSYVVMTSRACCRRRRRRRCFCCCLQVWALASLWQTLAMEQANQIEREGTSAIQAEIIANDASDGITTKCFFVPFCFWTHQPEIELRL